jgi:hypothetical protein
MDLAHGKTLTRLTEREKSLVFPEVFQKEIGILLGEPKADGYIYFEKDRHQGNFMVNFSKNPLFKKHTIYVYDYPLFSKIHVKERVSLLKLFGYLEYRKTANLVVKHFVDREIANLLNDKLVTKPIEFNLLKSEISSALNESQQSSVESVFSIISLIDELGRRENLTQAKNSESPRIKPSLVPFIVALGHAERYAEQSSTQVTEGGVSTQKNAFEIIMEKKIRQQFPQLSQELEVNVQESFTPKEVIPQINDPEQDHCEKEKDLVDSLIDDLDFSLRSRK